MIQTKTYIIALGGSIIYPAGINVKYLKRFYNFIRDEIRRGKRFIIIVGGGKSARIFQEAARMVCNINDEDKDWIGIHATRLNAHLLRTIFRREAHPVILKRRGRVASFSGHSVIIGAGWHPGWSTDFVAVQTAVDFKTRQVVVLGKPDFVYEKDNQKFENAKALPVLSWREYLKIIPRKWRPGMHVPVDPVAAKLAAERKIEVIVICGYNLDNLKNVLEGKSFKGTVIR